MAVVHLRLVACWWSVLALALAPVASAGTEENPDVQGRANGEDPTLDFLSAWFESAPDGVVFTMKIVGFEEPAPNHWYAVVFTYNDTRQVALVAFDEDGGVFTDLRPPNFDSQGVGSPSTLRNRLRDVDVRTGSPAYVSARIPFGILRDFGPGSVLEDLAAATGIWAPRGGWSDAQYRETTNIYVVKDTALPLFVQRNMVALAFGAGALIVAASAAIVAFVVLRRRRRAAPPPAGAPAPPPPAAAPPAAPVAPPPAAPVFPPVQETGTRFRFRPPNQR